MSPMIGILRLISVIKKQRHTGKMQCEDRGRDVPISQGTPKIASNHKKL